MCHYMKNPWFHGKHGEFTYGNTSIEPVVLVNSLTDHVKSRVVVCWAAYDEINNCVKLQLLEKAQQIQGKYVTCLAKQSKSST